MTMLTELGFSEARNNLTEVVDRAQRFEIPVIRPRKKSEDYCAVMRADLIKAILDKDMTAEFSTEVFREGNGSITISVLPFGITANGPTMEAAVHEAVVEVVDYAREYIDPANFPLYHRSPNRRSHLALVVKVLLCHTLDQIKELAGLA